MTRPRIEDNEVPASASDGDIPTVDSGVLVYAPPVSGGPTGPAGGVLSGTYPNPGFAADMATQAELDAHVNDTADAHDASAISFAPTGGVAATDVQAAVAELDSEKAPLLSPAFTGNPTAPTPSPGDNDTSVATTAFVTAAVVAASTAGALTTRFQPLVMVTGGVPELVYDSFNNLVMVEVPNP